MDSGRRSISHWSFHLAATLAVLVMPAAHAQLVDLQQSPNNENVGIAKSLGEQVAAGVGNVMTPNSSIYIIKRDPARAIRRGRQLFQRKFTEWQGLGPRTGDGTGNIEADASIGAGIADSCAGCHGRPRGAAGFGGDVATRPDSRDAPHLFGLGLQEMLADEITADLRAIRAQAIAQARATGIPVTRVLTSKGIDYGVIRAFPNGSVDTSQVDGVNADLRVRPFFAHGGTISIREFAVGAFNAEMGIDAVDPLLAQAANGGRITTPAGMVLDGRLDRIEAPPASFPGQDSDGDGVLNELPQALVDYMEFYLLNYFKPATYQQTPQTQQGLAVFNQIGCNRCHIQNLTINHDRRVADVETVYDPQRGIFNQLFSTVSLRIIEQNDGSGHPTLKLPAQQSFVVRNFFADLKRHDLGPKFHERNYDGSLQTEFMTEPLWGVGSTAPYGHDGRSINLQEVILRHGGEALSERNAFAALPESSKGALLEFLSSLVLFPPDDTASNLDPGDPTAPGFPQRGHGSINLSVLFNNPNERE
ncbi:MAG: thiol oxidoreductase-like protein [Steroidobacteraceae bacterium]|nr:thiol oxidoreductase-like protein [Steroidobacteraceae bacterium]